MLGVSAIPSDIQHEWYRIMDRNIICNNSDTQHIYYSIDANYDEVEGKSVISERVYISWPVRPPGLRRSYIFKMISLKKNEFYPHEHVGENKRSATALFGSLKREKRFCAILHGIYNWIFTLLSIEKINDWNVKHSLASLCTWIVPFRACSG